MNFYHHLSAIHKKRAKYVINLGITDQKVHQHKRTSICGNQGLSLISTSTNQTHIPSTACAKLGKFLLFLIRNVIPHTSIPDIFKPQHDIEKEYLQLFAKQLKIDGNEDLKAFNIPAVSLLINNRLSPHYDTLNPTNEEYDYTFSITVPIPMSNISENIREHLMCDFETVVPFCIVLYRRSCMMNISNRQIRIDKFVEEKEDNSTARKKIIELLSSTYSDADYGGLFFTQHSERLIKNRFKTYREIPFDDKICLTEEAVDKCGYFSSLIHMFYVYSYLNGLTREDVLSYVLFFAHQCNTTMILVQAMIDLCKLQSKKKSSVSLYKRLSDACSSYKEANNGKDVGSCGGIFSRFQVSNNDVYNEETVIQHCLTMNFLFAEATFELTQRSKNKLKPLDCIVCFHNLQKKIENSFKGFGPVRSSHLIQLASLLGVLPLQFYAFLPLHGSGGTGKFLTNEYGQDKINASNISDLQQFNVNELLRLQKFYGPNLTGNMLENISCIIGRDLEKKDIFYYLPWVTKDDKEQRSICPVYEFQLVFRLKVTDINNMTLVCRNNFGKEYGVLSTSTSTKSREVLNYNWESIDDNRSDIEILSPRNHDIDNVWMEKLRLDVDFIIELKIEREKTSTV